MCYQGYFGIGGRGLLWSYRGPIVERQGDHLEEIDPACCMCRAVACQKIHGRTLGVALVHYRHTRDQSVLVVRGTGKRNSVVGRKDTIV